MKPEPLERPSTVEALLEAAAIPSERRGRARTRRLDNRERGLYRWLLRRFADGGPPAAELECRADHLDIDLAEATAVFAADDLVHLDPATGAVLVAYPFSSAPRGHRVLIDGDRWVEAMCAIDALGIAAMLQRPIEVFSRDPLSGGEVWVRVDPGDGAWWEPEQAVVLAGSVCVDGPSFRSCCGVINFFESGEHALRYLLAHPEGTGHAIAVPEAIATGAAIFSDLLKED